MPRPEEFERMITVSDEEGNTLEWELWVTPGSGLKFPRSPDGREVYSETEGEFYFEDEPERIYRMVED